MVQEKNEDLRKELAKLRKRLENYEDLELEQMTDDAYVARGNGFCDMKYSEEFVASQEEALREKIAKLEEALNGAQ